MSGSRDDLSVEENQARALYEIADAIRGLLFALKYSEREGLSVAEAIEVWGSRVAEGLEAVASAAREAL